MAVQVPVHPRGPAVRVPWAVLPVYCQAGTAVLDQLSVQAVYPAPCQHYARPEQGQAVHHMPCQHYGPLHLPEEQEDITVVPGLGPEKGLVVAVAAVHKSKVSLNALEVLARSQSHGAIDSASLSAVEKAIIVAGQQVM